MLALQANGGCWFEKIGLWIVVGADNQGKHNYMTSPDGLDWTLRGSGGFGNFGAWDAAANNQMCIACGFTHMNYTTDGINWQPITDIFDYVSFSSITWKGLWVVTGGGGNGYDPLGYSKDGMTWTSTASGIFETANNAECNGKMWIATGSGLNSLAYSYDGMSWTGLGTTVLNSADCIAWNGKMWLATGQGGQIAYSYDGLSWSALDSDLNFPPTALTWFNDMWVIIGADGNLKNNKTLGFSPDGINWEITTNTILQRGRKLISK